MTEANAGAAGASAGPARLTSDGLPWDETAPGRFPAHATELLADDEYGVRFTSDYEPGEDYEPAPPPPAEEQHAMGLHEGAEGGE